MKIGEDALYIGSDHPYLFGRVVRIVSIHKGYFNDPDNCVIIKDNAALEHAGNITLSDLIEVVPYLDDEKETTSWIASDVCLNDLIPLRMVKFLLALSFHENVQLLRSMLNRFFYSPN